MPPQKLIPELKAKARKMKEDEARAVEDFLLEDKDMKNWNLRKHGIDASVFDPSGKPID